MHEPVFFCRNTEQFGDGSPLSIVEERRPTFWVDGHLKGFSRDDVMDIIRFAFNDAWGRHIDVIGKPADSAASSNLYVICTQLDGPGQVLGDCEMPRRGLRQQRMRLDVSENLVLAVNAPTGSLDAQAIVNHEVGHFLGWQHWPFGNPRELMEPAIQWGLRLPQPTEIAWGVKLFGAAKPQTPPPPSAKPVIATVEQGGMRWSGPIPRVA